MSTLGWILTTWCALSFAFAAGWALAGLALRRKYTNPDRKQELLP